MGLKVAADEALPETFRVYPLEDDPEFYFIVHISWTLDEMRETMRATLGLDAADVLACCYAVSAEDNARYAGLLGFLFFARERMGSGIVAHELVHAGFRTADASGVHIIHSDRRKDDAGLEWTNENEEQYADVVETLTKQFWREAYARGLAD